MKKHILLISFLTLITFFTGNATAQNRVVVIPMLGDPGPKPLKNVITVSALNGDYTTIEDALDSITDARPDNRYLIAIGPGHYLVKRQLILKQYVQISGSGRNITKLFPRVTQPVNNLSNAFILDQRVNDQTFFDRTSETREILISDLTIENQLHEDNSLSSIARIANCMCTVIFRNANLFMTGNPGTYSGLTAGSGESSSLIRVKLDNTELEIMCNGCQRAIGVEVLETAILELVNNSRIKINGTPRLGAVGVAQTQSSLLMDSSSIDVFGEQSFAISGFGPVDFPGIKSRIRRSNIVAMEQTPVAGSPDITQLGPGKAIDMEFGDPSASYTITQSTIVGSVRVSGGNIKCAATDNDEGELLGGNCESITRR